MEFLQTAALLGTLASVAGLLVAALQTVRLRELSRRNNADVWQSISTARSAMAKLEPCLKNAQDGAIREVYAKLTELFRHVLKQATLDERRFTEDTIKRWRVSGRLASDWQEQQARLFLPTNQIVTRK
jgi:hypothetical protein